MYMIWLILTNANYSDQIAEAWKEIGLSGITILLGARPGEASMKSCLQDSIPLMPGLDDLSEREEFVLNALTAMAKDRSTVELAIDRTKKIIGEFGPNTGSLVVLDVAEAYGFSS